MIEYYLNSSHCYIYEDKQLKSSSIVKEESMLIDSDLTTLYTNQNNSIYLPKSNSTKSVEKFNLFMEKLCEKLISENFKLKAVLTDLGLQYNLLTSN